jgi:hypothetical protein
MRTPDRARLQGRGLQRVRAAAKSLQFAPEFDLNFEVGHKARLMGGKLRIDTSCST